MDTSKALDEYNRLAKKLKPEDPFGGDPIETKEAKWRGIYTEEILMARADIQREIINRNLGLPEPFPASPSRPPKYLLRFLRRGELKSSAPFATAYAAARFLRLVTEDSEYTWKNDNTILVKESEFEVNSDELEEIIEYKLRGKEKEWELPEPYLSHAKEIATGLRQKRSWHALVRKEVVQNDRARARTDVETKPRPVSSPSRSGAKSKKKNRS